MKNLKDVHHRLKAEIDQWYTKQVKNVFDDFYLYYLPTNNQHDGGFLICSTELPNKEYQLVMRVQKHLTKEQNFNISEPMLRKLPILSLNRN